MIHFHRSMVFTLSVLLSSSCPVGAQAPSAAVSSSPLESRLTVFISDLHLGVGKDPATGKWQKEEDFRWKSEFVLFLKKIDEMGNGATDLVINGDTFELWQSLEKDCRYQDTNLGCTESEAVGRIQRVIRNHGPELKALGEFANGNHNRVILVPGNHDGALMFPAVAREALQAIPAASGRVSIPPEGYWLSSNGLVYAEHGHQIGKEVNRFDTWPAPFLERGGTKHLQRPWGEQFVQEYYNQFELQYPIIDNMESEQDGIRYGLATEGPAGVATATSKFFKFFLFEVSWAQLGQVLGPQEQGSLPPCKGHKPPCWDFQKIRDEQGDRFLVESLPQGDPFRAGAEKALRENNLGLALKDLSNEEITILCDKRALLKKTNQKITECPIEGTLGAIKENLLRSRDAIFEQYLETVDLGQQKNGKPKQSFAVFVYSHTHRADPGFSPMKGDWKPTVVNTGAWQRVVSPNQLEALRRFHEITEDKVLLTLEPDDLPPCYSVIMILPYEKRRDLNPQLFYWRKDMTDTWGFAASCDWKPGK